MKRFPLTIFIFSIVAVLSFSCTNEDESAQTVDLVPLQTTMAALENSAWTLTNYKNNPFEAAFENVIQINFETIAEDQIRFNGRSTVNYYVGTFTINQTQGSLFHTNETATTLIAGTNPRDNEIETSYYDQLSKVSYFELKDNQLWIYLGNKENTATEVMLFSPKS